MKRVGYIFIPNMEIPKNCAIFLLSQLHVLHSSRVIDRCNWWGLRNSIMGCFTCSRRFSYFIRLFHPLTILLNFHFCDITVWNILGLCRLIVHLTARHSSKQQPMTVIVKTWSVSCSVSKAGVVVFHSNKKS